MDQHSIYELSQSHADIVLCVSDYNIFMSTDITCYQFAIEWKCDLKYNRASVLDMFRKENTNFLELIMIFFLT